MGSATAFLYNLWPTITSGQYIFQKNTGQSSWKKNSKKKNWYKFLLPFRLFFFFVFPSWKIKKRPTDSVTSRCLSLTPSSSVPCCKVPKITVLCINLKKRNPEYWKNGKPSTNFRHPQLDRRFSAVVVQYFLSGLTGCTIRLINWEKQKNRSFFLFPKNVN